VAEEPLPLRPHVVFRRRPGRPLKLRRRQSGVVVRQVAGVAVAQRPRLRRRLPPQRQRLLQHHPRAQIHRPDAGVGAAAVEVAGAAVVLGRRHSRSI
jgi:hypothetical protein